MVTPENQLAYEANRMVDGLEPAMKELGDFMPKAFEVSIKESIVLVTEIVRIKTERESTLRKTSGETKIRSRTVSPSLERLVGDG